MWSVLLVACLGLTLSVPTEGKSEINNNNIILHKLEKIDAKNLNFYITTLCILLVCDF